MNLFAAVYTVNDVVHRVFLGLTSDQAEQEALKWFNAEKDTAFQSAAELALATNFARRIQVLPVGADPLDAAFVPPEGFEVRSTKGWG